MKSRFIIVYVFCWVLSGLSYVYAAPDVYDDSGVLVSLQKPAQRIISLAPHITEMLFAIGAGDRTVGAVNFSDYPEAAKKIPRVGGYNRFDLEAIVDLQPDLVIAWKSGNPEAQVLKLRELGFTIYFSDPKDFEGIATNLERFGRLTERQEKAGKAAEVFRQKYNQLYKQYAHKEKLRVFYQIWDQPLITVNGGHLIGSVIDVCGGKNVFDDIKVLAPHVSVESVLQRNPEVIIAGGRDGIRPDWLDDWKQWSGLPAIKEDNLFYVHADLMHRHAPRILQGAEILCGYLEQVRNKRVNAATEQ